jgi:EAL domain-containing protein (putative c-di-GMP-specific phosphodiesterase class I)
LKIDQSFVHNIGLKSNDAIIVQTILGMAQNLGIEVIAEGVETEVQRTFLEQHGCPAFQGFLFSKPVPIEGFEQLLRL